MAQYQNLFTTVQAVGPLHHGVELGQGNSPRSGQPLIVYWFGLLGNAQLGPIYLGGLGVASDLDQIVLSRSKFCCPSFHTARLHS